jgi:hypothetical protein
MEHTHELDPVSLDDAGLAALVERLVEEERRLSALRTTLHLRIDFLRGGGYAHLDASVDQLRELEHEEREVSSKRHDVHARLERALAERHRRAGVVAG